VSTQFFSDRSILVPGSLRGPRVYSTDLFPSLFNAGNVDTSLEIAARALKIKMLSRGLVTLNGAYLVSPMGLLLHERYPGLLDGAALLPAILSDRDGLAGFVGNPADYAAVGIVESSIADRIAAIERSIAQVMPWEVGPVQEQFRERLIAGLLSDNSLVDRQLGATSVYGAARRDALIAQIGTLDLKRSANLFDMIATEVPGALQEPLRRFATACYHSIGTAVVQCETGADLHPLSDFRAADMILTDRDASAERLSDETVFLKYFMARALSTIGVKNVAPSAVIDGLAFGEVHKLTEALRDSGFQDRYEVILEIFGAAVSSPDPGQALEHFDAACVTQATLELAKLFNEAIAEQVPFYRTREYDLKKGEFVSSGSDILLEGINATPIGNIVAIAKVAKNTAQSIRSGSDALAAREHGTALASADERRQEDIKKIVDKLSVSESRKASLLDGIAAMVDVEQVANRRA
jgi:hypothetical protein